MNAWLAKLGAGVTVALGILGRLFWLTKQRDRAREEAARERDRAEVGERVRDREREVENAAQRAREEAQEAARDEADRRSRGDRSGGLGNDRLRDR